MVRHEGAYIHHPPARSAQLCHQIRPGPQRLFLEHIPVPSEPDRGLVQGPRDIVACPESYATSVNTPSLSSKLWLQGTAVRGAESRGVSRIFWKKPLHANERAWSELICTIPLFGNAGDYSLVPFLITGVYLAYPNWLDILITHTGADLNLFPSEDVS